MDISPAENEPTAEAIGSLDEEKLLEWIQKKLPSLRETDNSDRFLKSRINGQVFLVGAGDVDFFMEAGLAFGPSFELAELAQNVIGDREQAGLAEPSDTTFKKRRLDSGINPELLNVAKRARERRELVVKKIITIDQDAAARPSNVAVQPSGAAIELSGVVAEFSSPTFDTKLPFPFVGTAVPKQFKVGDGDEGDWFYVGRERFTELLDLLRTVQRRCDLSALWVYGTKGYGKSHLLAALVCYLVAQKERVVYIPDCWECIKDPVEYVQVAMLFAWADDPTIQDEIITLNTWEMIYRFFHRHRKIIFVIDQMNVFEESDNSQDKDSGLKKETCRWLTLCRAEYPAILSTSPNYRSYLRQRIDDSNEDTMHVYGGFTTREMEQWWERNSKVTLGDYTKAQIEDITGCIPWLLDVCVVDGKIDLNVMAFRDIYHQAADFEQKIKTETRDKPLQWKLHYEYVKACFSRRHIPIGSPCWPKLIDHRYFYHYQYKPSDEDVAGDYGNYTCGLARNAVAAELLASKVDFTDTYFLRSSSNFINPSVAGFMMEYAVLSSIGLNGLAIGATIQKPMDIIIFRGATPNFRECITDGPVLYRPDKFNFKGIDGVIVQIETRPKLKGKGTQKRDAEEEKEKLFMYPFQITLAPDSHSDSHETFFNRYDKWTEGLKEFDIVPEFLWITPKPRSLIEHGEKSRPKWPAHRERYVSLEDVNKDWRWYLRELQDKEMSGDTGTEGQGTTEQGVQRHTGAEEQGDTGKQGDAEEQEMAEGGIKKRLRPRKVMPRDGVSKEDSRRRVRGERAQRGRGTRSK